MASSISRSRRSRRRCRGSWAARRCGTREPNLGIHAGLNAIDIERRDLGADHEVVGRRDKIHDRIAGADHTADGKDPHLLDDAGNRGAHIDAPLAITCNDHLLAQFRDGFLEIAEPAGGILTIILCQLIAAPGEFPDLLLKPNLAGFGGSDDAFDARLLTLQSSQARQGDEILVIEILNRLKFPGCRLLIAREVALSISFCWASLTACAICASAIWIDCTRLSRRT